MSGLSFDFETQLRGPWELAGGYVIETFERLVAQLSTLWPLIDGINTTPAGTPIGLTGYPTSSVLTTSPLGTPGFTNTLPCPVSFAASAIATPTTLTVNTNDYTPSNLSTSAVLRLAATGAINVTGLKAAATAQAILLVNIGGFAITLTHADVASVAANRWSCPGAANVVLAVPDSRWIWYDPILGVWQVLT